MKLNYKFKENLDSIILDEFWYDLKNGYIKPEELLENQEDIDKINNAIKILEDFENDLEELGEEC